MSQDLFWIKDSQWKKIAPLMPPQAGPARVDDRRVISGIIHVLRSGCRWIDCPRAYGPYTTVYNRFNRWSRRGIWQKIYAALTGDTRTARQLMADSSDVKAHRSASGAKGASEIRLWAGPGVAVRRRSMRSAMAAAALWRLS